MTAKVNPYVNFYNHGGEQSVHEDVTIELIQMYGQAFYYVLSDTPNLDTLFGEDAATRYENVYEIEALIENVDNFSGDGDFLSKFGIEIRDQATIVLSRSRFSQEIGSVRAKPLAGDLLYFPMTKTLFEIQYVEEEEPFYHLGRLYTYKLTVERFEFGHEDFDTGYPEIDEYEDAFSFAIALELGAGSGTYSADEWVYQGDSFEDATAKAQVISHVESVLTVKNLHGEFENGELVKGVSGASHMLSDFDMLENVNDGLADNKTIEDGATEILDFSEDDPFSEKY